MGQNNQSNDTNKEINNANDVEFVKKFSLGFRIAYAVIAWLLLGLQVPTGTSWFISIILYQVPFLIDYLSFKALSTKRLWIKRIEVIYSLVIVGLSFLGCAGLFVIVQNEGNPFIQINAGYIALRGVSISAFSFWIILIVTAWLNVLDYGQFSTKEEDELQETFASNSVAQK